MPDYVDWFVNRKKQFQGFLKMLARETPKSIMLIKAPADMGKTWLLQKMRHHCAGNGVPVVYVDFRDRRPYDYLSLVRLARDQMGGGYFNPLTAGGAIQSGFAGHSVSRGLCVTGLGYMMRR